MHARINKDGTIVLVQKKQEESDVPVYTEVPRDSRFFLKLETCYELSSSRTHVMERFNYEQIHDLESAKNILIEDMKSRLNEIMSSKYDWYSARFITRGIEVPEKIKEEISKLFEMADKFEEDVLAADKIEDLEHKTMTFDHIDGGQE